MDFSQIEYSESKVDNENFSKKIFKFLKICKLNLNTQPNFLPLSVDSREFPAPEYGSKFRLAIRCLHKELTVRLKKLHYDLWTTPQITYQMKARIEGSNFAVGIVRPGCFLMPPA